MNSEMDLMLLNKVKGIQGTVDNISGKVDTTIQKVEEGNNNVSQKLDNLQVDVDLSEIKHALNSTIENPSSFLPLDTLIQNSINAARDTILNTFKSREVPTSCQKISTDISGSRNYNTVVSVNGKGYADFSMQSREKSNKIKVVIDGVTMFSDAYMYEIGYDFSATDYYITHFKFRFSESIAVYAACNNTGSNYDMHFGGFVFFES